MRVKITLKLLWVVLWFLYYTATLPAYWVVISIYRFFSLKLFHFIHSKDDLAELERSFVCRRCHKIIEK